MVLSNEDPTFTIVITSVIGLLITWAFFSFRSLEKQKDQALLSFPPVEHPLLRVISPSLLKNYTGNSKGPKGSPSAIWIALYNDVYKLVTVYDVSSKADYYGPGRIYSCLSGRDASANLAFMNLDPHFSPSLTSMKGENRRALLEWCHRFDTQYPIMGHLHPHNTDLHLTFSGRICTPQMLATLREKEHSSTPIFIDPQQVQELRSRRQNSQQTQHSQIPMADQNRTPLSTPGRTQFSPSLYSQKSKRAQNSHRTIASEMPSAMSMEIGLDTNSVLSGEGNDVHQKIDHSSEKVPSIPGIDLLLRS